MFLSILCLALVHHCRVSISLQNLWLNLCTTLRDTLCLKKGITLRIYMSYILLILNTSCARMEQPLCYSLSIYFHLKIKNHNDPFSKVHAVREKERAI